MTPWARENIHQLFDYRYNAKLPSVITMSDEVRIIQSQRAWSCQQDDGQENMQDLCDNRSWLP